MSVTISDIYLRAGDGGELVRAKLYDCIQQNHLEQHEQMWKPMISRFDEEHSHWDWRIKWREYANQPNYESFAVECEGIVQGLMIAKKMMPCRIAGQANKHLVYVEYLETAPWNRRTVSSHVKFKGVGTVLLAAVIQLSFNEGNQGRIALHSLPQADAFYSRCGLTDLGLDTEYANFPLRYFEMSASQAEQFLNEGLLP